MLRSPILLGLGPYLVSVVSLTPQYSAASERLRPRLGILAGSAIVFSAGSGKPVETLRTPGMGKLIRPV